eukprot:TRINITY_DN21167_c0_g1_i1.p1 TRINITY_DN21167_c0_g1~~TRINITY_DN21167_c0_g1_i1.p1  ORF type:complete len:446 (+),score=58.00 TRINITY_DN21167_c0_g1_i1:120-1457(+)
MVGSQKSRRVSWASDGNLCKVRLFLSEDAPSQSGLGAQDHLQAKASWLWHSTGTDSDEHLPPGFEGPQSMDQFNKVSQITLVKWQCPPKIVLKPAWQVVSGEESSETEVQNQRELRVLEAVYPRPSAIPHCPSVSSEVQDYHHDDLHTPLIPITSIEDEEFMDPFDSMAPADKPLISQQPGLPKIFPPLPSDSSSDFKYATDTSQPNAPTIATPPSTESSTSEITPSVEPDVVAAASAAFTAIMRSSEEGSLIDRDLLIKILSNPKLVEKLVTEYGTPANPQTPLPNPRSPPTTISVAPPVHATMTESDTTGHSGPITNMAAIPTLNQLPPISIAKAPPVKDINYYKSLIKQHGAEKQEARDEVVMRSGNRHHFLGANVEPMQSSCQRDLKPKVQKPCLYFNSSKGCRRGTNCVFLHDSSLHHPVMPDAQSTKRIKLDREITGRS